MDSIEERATKLTRLLRLTKEDSPLAIATVKEALQAERDDAVAMLERETIAKAYKEGQAGATLETELAEANRLYHELIYAVAQKWPNESRHQTALRYILDREADTNTHTDTLESS